MAYAGIGLVGASVLGYQLGRHEAITIDNVNTIKENTVKPPTIIIENSNQEDIVMTFPTKIVDIANDATYKNLT